MTDPNFAVLLPVIVPSDAEQRAVCEMNERYSPSAVNARVAAIEKEAVSREQSWHDCGTEIAAKRANDENKIILSKDVECDTYPEQVAFLKGLKYEGEENIEVLAISFHDTPDFTTKGKHVVSVCFRNA